MTYRCQSGCRRLTEAGRLMREVHRLAPAAQPRQTANYFAIVAGLNPFNLGRHPLQHASERPRREVRIVFVIEIDRAPGRQGAVDARNLDEQPGRRTEAAGGELQRLQKAQRVDEMLEYMAADDK